MSAVRGAWAVWLAKQKGLVLKPNSTHGQHARPPASNMPVRAHPHQRSGPRHSGPSELSPSTRWVRRHPRIASAAQEAGIRPRLFAVAVAELPFANRWPSTGQATIGGQATPPLTQTVAWRRYVCGHGQASPARGGAACRRAAARLQRRPEPRPRMQCSRRRQRGARATARRRAAFGPLPAPRRSKPKGLCRT